MRLSESELKLSEEDRAKLGQPGQVFTVDIATQKQKMVPWDQASETVIDHGVEIPENTQVYIKRPFDMDEQAEAMQMSAPPIKKTSPQSKVNRLAALFIEEIRRRETAIGRPLTVADLSPQWIEALRVEVLRKDGFDLTDAMSLTTEHLTVAAQSWLQQGGNKVAENRGHVVRPF